MSMGGRYTTRITPQYIAHLGAPRGNFFTGLLLYDFETGKHDVRSNHQIALQRYLYPYLSGLNYSIWVGGLASRLGDSTENMQLSHLRAREVARRIEYQTDRAHSPRALMTTSFGESLSTNGTEDSTYRRAVVILVYRIAPYVEPSRPRTESPLPFFNRFKTTLVFGVEGGPVLIGCDYHYYIDYDDQVSGCPPSQQCEYSFLGLGGSIGAPAGSAGGIRWNRFSTDRNCTPQDFSGRASMGGYGINVWDFSLSTTRMSLFPNHGNPIHFEDFQTERAVSLGYSRVYGAFFRSGS